MGARLRVSNKVPVRGGLVQKVPQELSLCRPVEVLSGICQVSSNRLRNRTCSERSNCRRMNAGPNTRDTVRKAFEFALNHIGQEKDSTEIWQDYIEFLKTGEVRTYRERMTSSAHGHDRPLQLGTRAKKWTRLGRRIIALCRFPWTMSNAYGKNT